MNTPTAPASSPRITPSAWDDVRMDFQRSMMVNTTLAALAENIDGCVWPIKGPSETPASYISLDYTKAVARLGSLGQSPATLDRLVDILRGTLAFDESFGEMVEIAGKAEADHDPVPRNLERLGIPLNFPIRLCAFKPTTRDFCEREKITVLADFLAFARGASRHVLIGGEFKELLNAITHVDEATIARFLPFRIKTTGLFFVESLALLLRDLEDDQREKLITRPDTLPADLRARGDALAAYFKDQLQEMRSSHAAGTSLSRLVAPLDNLLREPPVASVLRLYLAPAASVTPARPARPGFFRRLFGFGK